MADTAQHLTFDRTLFHPDAAMRAMRDSRYRHESNAIAELIDNSIDARAGRVELLLFEEMRDGNARRVRRVGKLAVADNGQGMDPETLVRALSFGGRQADARVRRIGKYGVGLPTASASQCKFVEVWTWQESVDDPWHCFLDIGAVESGDMAEIPAPERKPLPVWLREHISEQCLNQRHGTVVLWKEIDRITARSETIFKRVERDLGRIHRYFINDSSLSIRLAAVHNGEVRSDADRLVRPFDPLFLMSDSATSSPWESVPMFKDYPAGKEFQIDVEDRRELVEIRYSIVKAEALGSQAQNPGSLLHGVDARFNAGVSIVREDRELLLERSFVQGEARRATPQDRWWGCEVRFKSGCDDVFGVDHNKQMAAAFSDIAQELATSEKADDELKEEHGEDVGPLYEIVQHIRNTVRSMRGDIDRMFAHRRELSDRKAPKSAAKDAEQRASQAVVDQLKESGPQSKTDVEHMEMSAEQRHATLTEFFESRGIADAAENAQELVESDSWFRFLPEELDGHRMFSVRSRGGVLIVHLNTEHSLYEFLKFLEAQDEAWRHRAAVAIRTLILAWARMEIGIERDEERYEVQEIAGRWGRQARAVIEDLNHEVGGGGGD